MNKPTSLLLAAGFALTALPALAQAPPPSPMHRAMTHAKHLKTGTAKTSNATVPVGEVIGNKKTHVFHVAGDHGSLPAPKNQVIFHSTAEATAAGYHAPGHGTAKAGKKMNPEQHGMRRAKTTSTKGRPMPPRALPERGATPLPVPISPR